MKRTWQKSLRYRVHEHWLQQYSFRILGWEVGDRIEDVRTVVGTGISPSSSNDTNGARLDWVGKLGRWNISVACGLD